MRLTYLEEMARKSYSANYTPLIFPKYDGMIGNAREHIRRYMDALMAHSHDHELRLKSSPNHWRVEPSYGTPAFCQGPF